MAKRNYHTRRRKSGGGKGRSPVKKAESKAMQLFKKHGNDLGEDYQLVDVHEFGFPFVRISLEVITSGKPDDIAIELHLLLLELISSGLTKRSSLADFLGLSENDFILDELYMLQENGLVRFDTDEQYRVTTKGQEFIQEESFIPVVENEDFSFAVNGLTGEITPEIPTSSNTKNRLSPTHKVDFAFINKEWSHITTSFSQQSGGLKQIVDLANYKKSISRNQVIYSKVYALIYHPKVRTGRKASLKCFNSDGKQLKGLEKGLENAYLNDQFLFDFDQEVKSSIEFKEHFIQESDQIQEDKKLSGKYQDVTTFEHRELIKDALKTAKHAVYIESPWIRKATLDYIPSMKKFLAKSGTSLLIVHGIDNSERNKPHKEAYKAIEDLQKQYEGRLHIVHLPSHFNRTQPERSGSHRKILIKDCDYYVKGSFNWLSYGGKESKSYAVEEGTQFFDNVKSFWERVWNDYKIETIVPSPYAFSS